MSRHDFFRKSQQRRYLTHPFRNPYFQNEPRWPWRWWGIGGGSILVLAAIVIFFLRAPAFAVQTVQIEGAESISVDHLHQLINGYLDEPRWFFFKNSNRFLFSEENLKRRLTDAYAFDTLDLSVDGPRLHLRLQERQSQLLWRTGEQWFVTDLQGVITRELTEEERGEGPSSPFLQLKKFVDVNGVSVSIGSRVLEPNEIVGVFRFHQHLTAQGIVYTHTNIDRVAGQWMSVSIAEGYAILFDPLGDIDAEATNLMVLLRDTIKDRSKLEYIDLRFGDHVYYK